VNFLFFNAQYRVRILIRDHLPSRLQAEYESSRKKEDPNHHLNGPCNVSEVLYNEIRGLAVSTINQVDCGEFCRKCECFNMMSWILDHVS